MSVKVICSAFYLRSNLQFYLLEREHLIFGPAHLSCDYLGQDDFVSNEPSLLLSLVSSVSLEFKAHCYGNSQMHHHHWPEKQKQ